MTKSFQLKSPEQLSGMLKQEKAAELWEYTRHIEADPEQVILFEKVFDEFYFQGGADIRWPLSPEHQLFWEEVFESSCDLLHFIENMPQGHCQGTFLTFLNHGHGEITVESGWLDAKAGHLLWDQWQGHTDNPAFAFAEVGFFFQIKDYQCVPKLNSPRTEQLFRMTAVKDKAEITCHPGNQPRI